jgi:hypothetical protein
MIDLMGGTIAFQSTPGSGTSVKIEVPLSIDTESDDQSGSEEVEQRPAHVRFLGFKSKHRIALSHVAASLKRQLQVSDCIIVRSITEADVVIAEEQYELDPHIEELRTFGRNKAKCIIMFGAATSTKRRVPATTIQLGDEEVPAIWLFRPLLPAVLDKIIDASRCRFWAPQGAEGDDSSSPDLKTGGMIRPDTTTTGSESEPDGQIAATHIERDGPQPSMSDPNIADLQHKRPSSVPHRKTDMGVNTASDRVNNDSERETPEPQPAFKGE